MDQNQHQPQLKKGLGLAAATALVMGNMIGSGIFMMPNTLANASGPGAALLAWGFTGIGSILLALTFANLGSPFRNWHLANSPVFSTPGRIGWAHVLEMRRCLPPLLVT
jgi:L-asparagine transporter-like permease